MDLVPLECLWSSGFEMVYLISNFGNIFLQSIERPLNQFLLGSAILLFGQIRPVFVVGIRRCNDGVHVRAWPGLWIVDGKCPAGGVFGAEFLRIEFLCLCREKKI